jgi:hypothetical protein
MYDIHSRPKRYIRHNRSTDPVDASAPRARPELVPDRDLAQAACPYSEISLPLATRARTFIAARQGFTDANRGMVAVPGTATCASALIRLPLYHIRRRILNITNSGIPWAVCRSIAVGTRITERPPHRSVRAAFPHTAPTSDV